MNETRHLTNAQLARAIDGEFTVVEQAEADEHLVCCEECLARYEALAQFSSEIERAVNATAVGPVPGARERLIAAIDRERAIAAARPVRPVRAWWWAAAAAAAVAIALLALPSPQPAPKQEIAEIQEQRPSSTPAPAHVGKPVVLAQAPTSGNSQAARKPRRTAPEPSTSGFMRLPYTDAALPVQAAGMVRVRMQLSMLAHAGVIQMSPGAPDAPVEADLLLGIDGQPYAVRLVSAHQ
jgi:hypothetical protein